jgi:hypothetical protein
MAQYLEHAARDLVSLPRLEIGEGLLEWQLVVAVRAAASLLVVNVELSPVARLVIVNAKLNGTSTAWPLVTNAGTHPPCPGTTTAS